MSDNKKINKQSQNDIVSLSINNNNNSIYMQKKFLQMASILNILDLKGMNDSENMPLLSIPFLDWINAYDFSDYTLIEFGSGNSTNYFAARFKKVISFETEKEWFDEVSKNKLQNVDLRMISIEDVVCGNYSIEMDEKTIVLIDGEAPRDKLIRTFLKKYIPSIIFLDNSEWFSEICQEVQENGYMEIPFWGIRFEEYYDKCTSVFIKNNTVLPKTRYYHYTKGAFIRN